MRVYVDPAAPVSNPTEYFDVAERRKERRHEE
jgi:hypothetical protein